MSTICDDEIVLNANGQTLLLICCGFVVLLVQIRRVAIIRYDCHDREAERATRREIRNLLPTDKLYNIQQHHLRLYDVSI